LTCATVASICCYMNSETNISATGNSAHPTKEVAMFSSSLQALFLQASPLAAKGLIAQGFPFLVAVENERGEWFWLNAESIDHAGNLARNWVDVLNARGASCWRIHPDGKIGPRPFATVFAQPAWEDAA
jgi:hypothetical protein